jgi:four helix bundle protein
MCDLEKLQVYQKAKEFNIDLTKEIFSLTTLVKSARDQLRRAAMSIMLNIAEGTSRFSNADKRNFYVISRGSVFECVSIKDLLCEEKIICVDLKLKYYNGLEEISKMLFAMIKNLEKK